MVDSEEEQVVVLDVWCSSYAIRVKLALEEKGIKYVIKEEDLRNKSSLLLEMNPVHKKIPVLIHNGNPVSESLVILEYIDDTWPQQSPLLPSDPYLRSRARFWADFIDNKIYGGATKLWRAKGEELEILKTEFLDSLKVLEQELGDGEFFGGDKFGYVDVAFVPVTIWFYSLQVCWNVSIDPHCPKLIEWVKRCLQRDTVARTLPHPHHIYEWVMGRKNIFGLQ